MYTEITEYNSGLILYDGQCAFCRRWAARSYRLLRRRGFRLASFQAPWVRATFGFDDTTEFGEMRLVTVAGSTFGGADALLEIARSVWWAQPLVWLGRIPAARRLLRAGYYWVAQRRNCLSGTCRLPNRHQPEQSRTSGFYELP